MARTIVPCTPIERAEDDAQRDMRIRAQRLADFQRRAAGKVWREQPNGEWWLVPVHSNTPLPSPDDGRKR